MGRTVDATRRVLEAQVPDDSRAPPAARVDPAEFSIIAPIDLSGLRVAISADLGFMPLDKRIRATFEERVGLFQSVFKSCERRDPEMRDADEAFAVIPACNFLAAHRERYEKHRDKLGPNIAANVEPGRSISLAHVSSGHALPTRICRS